MMQIIRQWIPAAILSCSLLFSACTTTDNPLPDDPATPSNGVWPINEEYVDKSIRPGDDFFMHRVGLWWAATAVDDNPSQPGYVGFTSDLNALLEEERPASPAASMMTVHLNLLDLTSEITAAFYDKAWVDCGYMAACEEAKLTNSTLPLWKCLGRMMAQGAPVPFIFEPVSVGGKVGLLLWFLESAYPYKAAGFRAHRRHDADFYRSLTPLVGGAGTRAVSGDKWPQVVAMLNEAGIDPSLVYMPTEYPHYPSMNAEDQKAYQKSMDFINEYCGYDVETLANKMVSFGHDEAQIVSSEANFQAHQQAFKKQFGTDLTKNDILYYYSSNYMSYELSYLVGKKFVTDAFRQDGVAKCKALISVFADRIKANKWLSEEGKQAALEKLSAININVGCPETWITEAIPDLSQSSSALEDAYLLRKAALNYHKYLAGKAVKDVSFHTIIGPNSDSPLTILNAYYNPNFNSINIYPWWLMKPCYDSSYDQAVNYAIMIVVAHEITHGFDSSGYKFNKDGDPVSIFTNPVDEANFTQLGKKLAARFNELEVLPKELPGVMSKGDYCLGENIADLGGFEIAFEAYTRYLQEQGVTGDDLTYHQQCFFYASVEQYRAKYGPNYVKLMQEGRPATDLMPEIKPDIHSLDRERVNGVMRNVDIWYDLFGVQQGDALYLAPADRVHIW